MIEGGGGDNRIALGARSISCSDSVMRNTNQQQLMNHNRNSHINCIRIEHAIDSNEHDDVE